MMTIPFEKITTIDGARTFIDWLMEDVGVGYTPEENFENYVDREGNPSFTEPEYKRLNELNNQCWKVCKNEVDGIYTIAQQADDAARKRRNMPPMNWKTGVPYGTDEK